MILKLETLLLLKAFILVPTISILLFQHLIARQQLKDHKLWIRLALALLAILSILSYFDFGHYPKFQKFRNPWDFFHYYHGAKYFQETGYLYLYESTTAAEAEKGEHRKFDRVRNMTDYRKASPSAVVKKALQYKKLFTPERWEEFKKDVTFFKHDMRPRQWKYVLTDRGMNGSPFWLVITHYLSNQFSVDEPHHLFFLMSLDIMLLMLMTMLIYYAFGFRASCFFTILFCASYIMGYTHIRGGFLRLDWFVALISTLCMIKKSHYKIAGLILAYATCIRIFPAVFAFGIGSKMVWDFIENRKVSRKYLEFFSVYFISCAFFIVASSIYHGETTVWLDFFKKMKLHDMAPATRRAGARYLFLMTHGKSYAEVASSIQHFYTPYMQILWWAIQFSVMGFVFYIVRKLKDFEAFSASYIVAFFMFATTFYYQLMALVLFFLFYTKLKTKLGFIGVLYLFSSWVFLILYRQYVLPGITMSYVISITFFILAIYAAFSICAERWMIHYGKEGKGEGSLQLRPSRIPSWLKQRKVWITAIVAFVLGVIAYLLAWFRPDEIKKYHTIPISTCANADYLHQAFKTNPTAGSATHLGLQKGTYYWKESILSSRVPFEILDAYDNTGKPSVVSMGGDLNKSCEMNLEPKKSSEIYFALDGAWIKSRQNDLLMTVVVYYKDGTHEKEIIIANENIWSYSALMKAQYIPYRVIVWKNKQKAKIVGFKMSLDKDKIPQKVVFKSVPNKGILDKQSIVAIFALTQKTDS